MTGARLQLFLRDGRLADDLQLRRRQVSPRSRAARCAPETEHYRKFGGIVGGCRDRAGGRHRQG